MTAKQDAVRAKATELASVIEKSLMTAGFAIKHADAVSLVDNLATIQPPEYDTSIHLITMAPGGRDGATSVKPGNITLHMRRLVSAASAGLLTTVGAFQAPWLAVFGALVIWNDLYSGATVDLSERDATVAWTLWRLRDDASTVAHEGLLSHVNEQRAFHGRSPLSEAELTDALRKLKDISAIRRSRKDDSRWWLREWVRIRYQ